MSIGVENIPLTSNRVSIVILETRSPPVPTPAKDILEELFL